MLRLVCARGVAQKQLQKCLEKSPSQEAADPGLLLRELQARPAPSSMGLGLWRGRG